MELTLKEAYEALLRGEAVVDNEGDIYRYDSVQDYIVRNGLASKPDFDCVMRKKYAPFTLYKPEPKTLSFDQAVRALSVADGPRIVVETPFGDKYSHIPTATIGATKEDMVFLDLAERRGWPIQEIQS